MKYNILFRQWLLVLVTLGAAQVQAATTDYTLKYDTWELISIPNPIPFAVNTPMKMFGEQIAEKLPQAVYGLGGDWIMFSYDSLSEAYQVADKDAVFDPGKGYWAIQVASMDPISVQVDIRYFIGSTGPSGGIVFYIDPNSGGTSGLEAALVDQGMFQWGCSGTEINGADGSAVGTGSQNTVDILDGCLENNIAATVAFSGIQGLADWFLPSSGEMALMYRNLHQQGLGGFADDLYWTSTETDPNFPLDPFNAVIYDFRNEGGGEVRDNARTVFYPVRVARAF